jgi:hypothetical protein
MSNSLVPTLEEFQRDPLAAVIMWELIYIVTLFITSGASFILGLIIGTLWAWTI